jgi:hypothetical protein
MDFWIIGVLGWLDFFLISWLVVWFACCGLGVLLCRCLVPRRWFAGRSFVGRWPFRCGAGWAGHEVPRGLLLLRSRERRWRRPLVPGSREHAHRLTRTGAISCPTRAGDSQRSRAAARAARAAGIRRLCHVRPRSCPAHNCVPADRCRARRCRRRRDRSALDRDGSVGMAP